MLLVWYLGALTELMMNSSTFECIGYLAWPETSRFQRLMAVLARFATIESHISNLPKSRPPEMLWNSTVNPSGGGSEIRDKVVINLCLGQDIVAFGVDHSEQRARRVKTYTDDEFGVGLPQGFCKNGLS